jgi:hypothetical protein
VSKRDAGNCLEVASGPLRSDRTSVVGWAGPDDDVDGSGPWGFEENNWETTQDLGSVDVRLGRTGNGPGHPRGTHLCSCSRLQGVEKEVWLIFASSFWGVFRFLAPGKTTAQQ